MPDGGYPMNLVTPIVDSPFVLALHGADVHLKERFFPDPESRKFQLVSHGALSSVQVTALLFHLLEWGSRLDSRQIQALSYERQSISPQFDSPACRYDF